jgi:hypothetical protein
MSSRCLLICSLFVFLTGCIPATSMVLPTLARFPDTATPKAIDSPLATPSNPPTPSFTPAQPENTPTSQAIPTEIPTLVPTTPLPTLPFSPTLTLTPVPQPSVDSSAIQLLSPGPLSKIVPPVRVFGYAVPGFKNKGSLDLYGEDGQVLASQLLQLNTPYKWASFYWELAFKTRSVGELGRLSLSTVDEFGRITGVNSVHLILLGEGVSIINPPGSLQERCVIEQPVAGQRSSNGVLSLVGKMRPYNGLPLTVELVAPDGTILGTRLVPVSPAQDDSHVPFRVDISYRIPVPQWVLLRVRQFDDRISGVMYLYSKEILLNP